MGLDSWAGLRIAWSGSGILFANYGLSPHVDCVPNAALDGADRSRPQCHRI